MSKNRKHSICILYLQRYIKSRRRWIRQNKRRALCRLIGVILGMLLICGGSIAIRQHRQNVKEAAFAKEQQEKERQKEKKLKAEAEQIEAALSGDVKYGGRLRELYGRYPQLKKLLLNRDAYPERIMEYFMSHEEAVDWVVDYPEYAQKTEAERNEEALRPVHAEAYTIQRNIPLYLQWDQAWGYASYGDGVVAIDGCGPTCLSMVVTGLTGDYSMNPKKIADFSAENGFLTESEGTSWSLMEVGAGELGVHSRQIEKWSASEVIKELQAGHPMICSMGPGDFTEQGHFIVLCGVTEDGRIILNDPNSRINSRKTWEVNHLLEQMKAMWALSLK